MQLREARNAKGLAQEEVSHQVGISLRHYQKIEAYTSIPSVITALSICHVLGVDVYDIDEWNRHKKKRRKSK